MPRGSMPTSGAAIRRHRQLAGWTLVGFAQHARISKGHLSRLENGGSASPPMLKRIADALGISVRDLSPDEDHVATPA